MEMTFESTAIVGAVRGYHKPKFIGQHEPPEVGARDIGEAGMARNR